MRRSKINGSSTTNYLSDGLSTIRETNEAGALIAEYSTDPTQLIGQVLNRTDFADNASFYSTDGLGSTATLTDLAQNQAASYSYDGFGNVINHTGAEATYAFSTKEQDSTGLYYFAARYYDPETGRFTTKDPASANLYDPQSLNRYVYVRNNPINMIDPFGLWYEDINLSGGLYGGGVTGGVMIDWEQGSFYPYFGGGAMTPGVGGSITWNPGHPAQGWNAGLSGQAGVAGQLGYAFKCGGIDIKKNGYWELGIGADAPEGFGAQLTGFYVWRI